MTTSKRDFNISKLVEEVHEIHSLAAAEKGLRFTFGISHKVPRMLFGDADSIRQALSVITKMAIEDSKNGTVEVNVDLETHRGTSFDLRFAVDESSRHTPYSFSVSLELAKSKQTA